jgi:hypothetical protein
MNHDLAIRLTVLAALGGESTAVQQEVEGETASSTFLREPVFGDQLLVAARTS